jgi:hypothetical protein
MKLRLHRFEYGSNYTIGRLYSDDNYVCYVLEDRVREVEGRPVTEWKVPNETAIPRGTYKVIIDFSPHFQRDLPHILDVPGYENIRIHSGNSDKDTEGCLLVGLGWAGTDWISGSKDALDRLFPLIKQATDVTITIEG